jgi:hypothetical protein
MLLRHVMPMGLLLLMLLMLPRLLLLQCRLLPGRRQACACHPSWPSYRHRLMITVSWLPSWLCRTGGRCRKCCSVRQQLKGHHRQCSWWHRQR